MTSSITLRTDSGFTGNLELHIHADGSVTALHMDTDEDALIKDPAVLGVLARHEAKTPGTPSRKVAQTAIAMGYQALPPGGSGQGKYVRLRYTALSHRKTITLYLDSVKLASQAGDQWQFAETVPNREPTTHEVRFYFKDAAFEDVLRAFKEWADKA